jgi:glycosyltransferase involved in cell wall biosynthesis
VRTIIGTYRKQQHIDTALRSLEQHVTGITDLVFIDDSGDPDNAARLTQHGKVIETGAQGYNAAMKAACDAAENQPCFWFEEDFQVITPINLNQLAEILHHRPYLAQIALLRGPHFPIEHHTGGLLQALKAKGHTINDVDGVLEQTATFTGNPSVWRAEVFNMGWPTGKLSEELKRDQLLAAGYRFGFLPGIRVTHHGQREGHGY